MYNFDLRKKKNSITKIALLIMHQGQLERKKKLIKDCTVYASATIVNTHYVMYANQKKNVIGNQKLHLICFLI